MKVYLVAAEASGDALGADLVDAIRAKQIDVDFIGVGGASMSARGISSLFDISSLAILGLVEGLKAYGLVRQRVEETAQDIIAQDPDVVVLIDSWGFMWRVAKRMKELGSDALRIKLVGPQVWATRPGRAKTLAAHVDHLLCIHAFETPFYEPHGLPTTVIGNPALSRHQDDALDAFKTVYAELQGKRLIGLLPGSRNSEIRNVAPVLEEAARQLCEADSERFVVCVAPESVKDQVIERSRSWAFPHMLVTDEGQKSAAFKAMDVALACSGTVTTELAMQGAPVVVGYKIGWMTWAIARAFLLKSKYISLVNVAANSEVMPEFVQTRFNARNLTEAAEAILASDETAKQQIAAQYAALDSMGRNNPPAAQIAADKILQLAAARS